MSFIATGSATRSRILFEATENETWFALNSTISGEPILFLVLSKLGMQTACQPSEMSTETIRIIISWSQDINCVGLDSASLNSGKWRFL